MQPEHTWALSPSRTVRPSSSRTRKCTRPGFPSGSKNCPDTAPGDPWTTLPWAGVTPVGMAGGRLGGGVGTMAKSWTTKT